MDPLTSVSNRLSTLTLYSPVAAPPAPTAEGAKRHQADEIQYLLQHKQEICENQDISRRPYLEQLFTKLELSLDVTEESKICEDVLDELNCSIIKTQIAACTRPSLTLRHCSLTRLPESVISDPQLAGFWHRIEKLDLSYNAITVLPDAITTLSNIQTLSLQHNQLLALPEDIGTMEQLTELHADNNNLTNLPTTLKHLTSLRLLALARNKLTHLPHEIGQMEALEELYLAHNRLDTLPESIANLPNLINIQLSNNHLALLPCNLCRLTTLCSLDLSYNQFATIPKVVWRLTNLTELLLDGNVLVNLSQQVERLTNLYRLSIEGNELTALPEALTRMEVKVYARDNRLLTLPDLPNGYYSHTKQMPDTPQQVLSTQRTSPKNRQSVNM